jgi:DNA-binding MarR family transcriptional regulator
MDDGLLHQYASNLPRHLIAVAHAAIRSLLPAESGFGGAALGSTASQLVLQLSLPGARIAQLARRCGITQQAAGGLLAQLERRGLLVRAPDPGDRRAHALRLTASGVRLRRRLAASDRAFGRHLRTLLGHRRLAQFRRDCGELAAVLVYQGEPMSLIARTPGALCLALTGLATHCEHALMDLARSSGFLGLKLSYGQVLTHLSPPGATIADLARINSVSKQGISRIVRELETRGFIERRLVDRDRRTRLVVLSRRGFALIRASITNIAVLEQQFTAILGRSRSRRLARMLEELAQRLEPPPGRAANGRPGPLALERAIERLYAQRAALDTAELFIRSGDAWRLSPEALRLLARLRLRSS